MKLIGISGYKQNGKSTVAAMLEEMFKPLTVQHINFADGVKDEICRIYGVSRQYLEAHKANFRLILQGHGTDYRRTLFGEDYWIEKWLMKTLTLSGDVVVISSDLRFRNEYLTINQADGITVRVRRSLNHDPHTSETELDNYLFDHEIENYGSLEQLKVEVEKLYQKIK